jgi:hypothetical protein
MSGSLRLSAGLPSGWARNRSRVMERVLADKPLVPILVHRKESGDHRRRGCSLRPRDGLLVDNDASFGANGDVCHTLMFDAPWIAPTEIHTRRCRHIHPQPRDAQVVVGRHSALNAFPPPSGVIPHAETCLSCMLHQPVTDHDLQRTGSRKRARRFLLPSSQVLRGSRSRDVRDALDQTFDEGIVS